MNIHLRINSIIDINIEQAKKNTKKPTMIIAHTIKGKGISYMEDNNNWHYRTPNKEELKAVPIPFNGSSNPCFKTLNNF